jgi:hypothetical protein
MDCELLHTVATDSVSNALEQDNTQVYRIVTIESYIGDALLLPNEVTFTTSDHVGYPLPDPRYLELHAVCARLVHLSGTAEYINFVTERMNEGGIAVLDEDGGSAEILGSYLRVAQSRMAPVD